MNIQKNTATLKNPTDLPALLTENMSLSHLQNYMEHMVKQRGFEDESARDTMLLMVEEVGELAKAIRKISGIKIEEKSTEHYANVQDELADVLIYLLVLANRSNINLFDALKQKETKNASRVWKKANI